MRQRHLELWVRCLSAGNRLSGDPEPIWRRCRGAQDCHVCLSDLMRQQIEELVAPQCEAVIRAFIRSAQANSQSIAELVPVLDAHVPHDRSISAMRPRDLDTCRRRRLRCKQGLEQGPDPLLDEAIDAHRRILSGGECEDDGTHGPKGPFYAIFLEGTVENDWRVDELGTAFRTKTHIGDGPAFAISPGHEERQGAELDDHFAAGLSVQNVEVIDFRAVKVRHLQPAWRLVGCGKAQLRTPRERIG